MRRIVVCLAVLCALTATAAVAFAQEPEESITTLRSAPMPSLVGKSLDDARRALDAHGIYYDLEVEEVTSAKAGTRPGTVLEQDPPAGDEIESGIGDLEPVGLTVYVPKASAVNGKSADAIAACKVLSTAVKGGAADIGLGLLRSTGAKPTIDYRTTTAKTDPKLTAVARDKARCGAQAAVQISNALQQQDLYLVLQPRKRRQTLAPVKVAGKTQLVLVAGQPNYLTADVFSRSTQKRIAGATIDLDASDVGGRDVRGKSAKAGKTSLKVTPKRGGGFDVVATVPTGSGRTLYGVARINVRTPAQMGAAYRTMRGDLFVKKGSRYKYKKLKLPKRKARAAATDEAKNAGEVLTDEQVCAGFSALLEATCGEGGQISAEQARDAQGVTVLDSDSPITQDAVIATTQTKDLLVQAPGQSSVATTSGPTLSGFSTIGEDGTISAPATAALNVTLVGVYRNPVTYYIPPVLVQWFKGRYENWLRGLAARYGVKVPSIDPKGRYTIFANSYPPKIVKTSSVSASEEAEVPSVLGSLGVEDGEGGVAVDYQATEGTCADFGQWVSAGDGGEANLVGGLGQRAC